jgi:hypothetical protein
MTPMSAANRRDRTRVARGGEPIVNGGADFPAPDRRIAWAMMPGDQKDDALAPGDRLFQPAVDRAPGAIEREAVKIEHTIGLDGTGPKTPVPTRIQAVSKRGWRSVNRTLRRLGQSALVEQRLPSIFSLLWFVLDTR